MLNFFKWVLFIIFLFFIIIVAFYFQLPDPKDFKNTNPDKTSFMQMRVNESRAKGKKMVISHKYVPYTQISQDLKDAVRISEDGEFFFHNGLDFGEIKESIITNIKKRRFKRGGSTITQQLAKNLYLSSEKSLVRKIKEAFLAFKIENQLSKQRIFDLYLNYIEFGNGMFGVESACLKYFKKPASKISIFESVRLASIIPNPRKWSPNNPTKRLKNTTKILLTRMYKFKKISKKEYEKALKDFEKFF